jgi:hypothetical protein
MMDLIPYRGSCHQSQAQTHDGIEPSYDPYGGGFNCEPTTSWTDACTTLTHLLYMLPPHSRAGENCTLFFRLMVLAKGLEPLTPIM